MRWYPARDSNPEEPASEAGAFTNFASRANGVEYGSPTCVCGVKVRYPGALEEPDEARPSDRVALVRRVVVRRVGVQRRLVLVAPLAGGSLLRDLDERRSFDLPLKAGARPGSWPQELSANRWSGWWESNPRLLASETSTLAAELHPGSEVVVAWSWRSWSTHTTGGFGGCRSSNSQGLCFHDPLLKKLSIRINLLLLLPNYYSIVVIVCHRGYRVLLRTIGGRNGR